MAKPREVIQSFVYGIAFSLGVIIVILGTLTAIVGAFFFIYKCWGYEAATPLWTGAIFILTGVLACCMRGCKESKGAVRTVFAMCIVSAVMALMLGGHGWVAATQEHTSPSCGHGIDAGCTSMTGRISIDVSMVVLAIHVFEIVIVTAIVTYFMMEGGPIGPLEKIEGLPIGKGRSRGPGTRSAATVSSNAKRYPEPTSAEEGEAVMMATSSPTNYELGSEPPIMRYIPDPDYSTADDLEDEKQIEKPDSAFVATSTHKSWQMAKLREVIQSFVFGIAFSWGMILVILGTLTAIVGAFSFIYKCWGYEAATPLWTGAIFIVTGVLACCMRGCKESKGAVRTVFAMCIVSAVMALLLGGHGWVAATQEHTSPSCGHGIDAGCTSMIKRISIDVSMVGLAILVFEIVILTDIVTFCVIEGGPIDAFEIIERLPIGKGRSRGLGTRSAAIVFTTVMGAGIAEEDREPDSKPTLPPLPIQESETKSVPQKQETTDEFIAPLLTSNSSESGSHDIWQWQFLPMPQQDMPLPQARDGNCVTLSDTEGITFGVQRITDLDSENELIASNSIESGSHDVGQWQFLAMTQQDMPLPQATDGNCVTLSDTVGITSGGEYTIGDNDANQWLVGEIHSKVNEVGNGAGERGSFNFLPTNMN